MPSAVALISGVWSAMRIVGPASAGVLIALVGTGHAFSVCAALNGLAFFVMLAIRAAPRPEAAPEEGDDGGVSAALRFVFARPVFFATIGLSFFTSVFGSSYVILLPIFADELLEVGSEGFGFMEAVAGVGSLAGTWWIIRRGIGARPGALMLASAAAFGVLIAAFAATDHLAPASALLLVSGFAAEVYLIIGMTVGAVAGARRPARARDGHLDDDVLPGLGGRLHRGRRGGGVRRRARDDRGGRALRDGRSRSRCGWRRRSCAASAATTCRPPAPAPRRPRSPPPQADGERAYWRPCASPRPSPPSRSPPPCSRLATTRPSSRPHRPPRQPQRRP